MEKLTFPTVTLLSFSRKPTGGKAVFSGSVTTAVARAMEWTDIPECATSAALDGELSATQVELVPKDEALRRHAIILDTSKVAKFELVRREIEGKKGKGHRQELQFSVWFPDVKGARKLEEYMLTCGKSTLSVSYQKQAQQADLPGAAVKEDLQESLGVQ